MANYSLTAANVKASADAVTKRGVAAEAIAAGQPVYRGEDRRLLLSDADVDGKSAVEGIALNSAGANQPVVYAESDPALDLGTTVASGGVVILSRTAGAMCPVGDAEGGDRVIVLGVGTGGTKMSFLATPLLRGGVVPI